MPSNIELNIHDCYRIKPKQEAFTVVEESRSSLKNDNGFIIALKVKTGDDYCWIQREVLEKLFNVET